MSVPINYYILSLKHSQKYHGFLTWWAPKDNGYVARLKDAGVYTEEELQRKASYYQDGEQTMAFPCGIVDRLARPAAAIKGSHVNRNLPGHEAIVPYSKLDLLKEIWAASKDKVNQ